MFETKNTKLAAALLTMGFEDGGTEFSREDDVVLRIRDGIAFGYAPAELQGLWRDRIWQEHNEHHPFFQIVKVAEARDWLLSRVIYHYHGEPERPVGPTFGTDELGLAACIVADGFYLQFFEGRTFYFSPDAVVVEQRYRHADAHDLICWQVHYLRKLKELLERIRNRNEKKRLPSKSRRISIKPQTTYPMNNTKAREDASKCGMLVPRSI